MPDRFARARSSAFSAASDSSFMRSACRCRAAVCASVFSVASSCAPAKSAIPAVTAASAMPTGVKPLVASEASAFEMPKICGGAVRPSSIIDC